MRTEKIVYAIKEIVKREDAVETQRMIFEKKKDIWVYHAPNAQDHTEEQLEEILKKLKELNKRGA